MSQHEEKAWQRRLPRAFVARLSRAGLWGNEPAQESRAGPARGPLSLLARALYVHRDDIQAVVLLVLHRGGIVPEQAE